MPDVKLSFQPPSAFRSGCQSHSVRQTRSSASPSECDTQILMRVASLQHLLLQLVEYLFSKKVMDLSIICVLVRYSRRKSPTRERGEFDATIHFVVTRRSTESPGSRKSRGDAEGDREVSGLAEQAFRRGRRRADCDDRARPAEEERQRERDRRAIQRIERGDGRLLHHCSSNLPTTAQHLCLPPPPSP